MRHLSVDLETFSDVDLKKCGLYKYAESPAFEILLIGFAFDNETPVVIDMTKPLSAVEDELLSMFRDALMAPHVIKHAYNASFEITCLNRAGFYTPPDQWRCTMLHGLYCGFPGGLGAVGEAVGLPSDKRKLGIGMSLIRTFCVPQKPTKTNGGRTRILPERDPGKWKLFVEYNRQDVVTEREIERRLSAFPVPEREQHLWVLDLQMNARGVCVDTKLIDSALSIGQKSTEALLDEAKQISGLSNPKSVQQLTKWLNTELDEEEDVDNLRKATVQEMLTKGVASEAATRMLELRLQLGKTSTKKYDAAANAVCADERIRGLMQFYGANRTGRWAGRLVQVQNLPRNYLDTLDTARALVKSGSFENVAMCYADVQDTLSQLIRTIFVASPGNKLAIADYSAIEARVIAWLAGEEWRQEVFATHGKIYEASASQMFHVPLERIKKGNPEYALRQKGKVAELALGYQGSVGALIAMGALKMGLQEDELPEIVQKWREASPAIVQLWYDLDRAAKKVITQINRVTVHGLTLAMEADTQHNLKFLTIQLPTGRKLFYSQASVVDDENGRTRIKYAGVDQKTKKWGWLDTYGGKIAENCVFGEEYVLTPQGEKRLKYIANDDLIWDGEDFVKHEGLIDKGLQTVVSIDGIIMTPDHKILTEKGWMPCVESEGLNWAKAVLYNSNVPCREQQEHEGGVASEMRLREGVQCRRCCDNGQTSSTQIVRVHDEEAYCSGEDKTRNVYAPSICCMALNEAEMQQPQASSLQELRRKGNNCLPRVGSQLRGVLEGYEGDLQTGAGLGSDRQQRRIFKSQLPLDDKNDKYKEPKSEQDYGLSVRENDSRGTVGEDGNRRNDTTLSNSSKMADRITVLKTGFQTRVYDLRNCGPRHRFAIIKDGKARIVSNCTQAIARDCLAELLLRLEQRGYNNVVFHVHDEVCARKGLR